MDFHVFHFFIVLLFFLFFFHIWPPPGTILGSPACPNLPDTPSRDSPDPAELAQCRQIGLPRQPFGSKRPQPGTLKVHHSNIVALGSQDLPNLAFQRHVLAILRIWVSQPSPNQRAEGIFQQCRSPGHSKMPPILRSKCTGWQCYSCCCFKIPPT